MSIVQEILDRHLKRQFEGNKEKEFGNRRPDPSIPKEMIDPDRPVTDDWVPWRAIKSSVSDDNLSQLETEIGFKFPLEYRDFLQWKHFYEIDLNDRAISLRPHVLGRWKEDLLYVNRVDGLTQHLLEQKLWYFADFQDYALLMLYCGDDGMEEFGTILYVDHENPNEYHVYSKNLETLLEHDKEFSNKFIEKLNMWDEKTNS